MSKRPGWSGHLHKMCGWEHGAFLGVQTHYKDHWITLLSNTPGHTCPTLGRPPLLMPITQLVASAVCTELWNILEQSNQYSSVHCEIRFCSTEYPSTSPSCDHRVSLITIESSTTSRAALAVPVRVVWPSHICSYVHLSHWTYYNFMISCLLFD